MGNRIRSADTAPLTTNDSANFDSTALAVQQLCHRFHIRASQRPECHQCRSASAVRPVCGSCSAETSVIKRLCADCVDADAGSVARQAAGAGAGRPHGGRRAVDWWSNVERPLPPWE